MSYGGVNYEFTSHTRPLQTFFNSHDHKEIISL